MFFQIFLLVLFTTSIFGNYYEILGVSRSATDYDIKNSYKKLARKWHPDKNRSPEANDHFTKINEAYEALSNQEKRREYDAFGSISNEPRDNNRYSNSFFNGNAFFDFGQNENSDPQFESINYRSYKMDVLPQSHTQPTLILLVSHFCFSCHHAMRLWGSIATQITESGIHVKLADVMADAHLREELRIHHVPTVVMIIDGLVKYLQSEINKETVIDFIRYSFPKDLVYTIQSDGDLNQFHDTWFKDSRSKMIMTKPLDRPSFRYLSAAFKYREKISAGFIHLDDTNERLNKLSNAYNLRKNEETVLIFHDEKHFYSNIMLPKSIARKSQTRLTLPDIESLVQANYLLPFPRLLSQTIFDLACPPPSQKQRSYSFCAITVVHSKHKNNLSESDSWQYVRSLIGEHGHGKMMYLFGDVQYKFLQSLRLVDPAQSSIDMFMDQVILLWRQSYTSATSLFLSNPWQYSNVDMVLQNWNQLSNFDKAVSILKTRHQLQNKIIDSDTLTELVDELAAPLWMKIAYRMLSYCGQIYVILYDFFTEPFNLLIAVLGLALASYVYSTIKAVSAHFTDDDKHTHSQSSNPPQTQFHSPSTQSRHTIPELTIDSYQLLLKDVKQCRLTCVVLTTRDTSVTVLSLVQECVARLKCDGRLLAVQVRLDDHPRWLGAVLAAIEDEGERQRGQAAVGGLCVQRAYSSEGLVLAMNVGRCYVSVCPVNVTWGRGDGGDRHDPSLDLDSSSDDGGDAAVRHTDVSGRFFDWLCQLTEGTCHRYRVGQWPASL